MLRTCGHKPYSESLNGLCRRRACSIFYTARLTRTVFSQKTKEGGSPFRKPYASQMMKASIQHIGVPAPVPTPRSSRTDFQQRTSSERAAVHRLQAALSSSPSAVGRLMKTGYCALYLFLIHPRKALTLVRMRINSRIAHSYDPVSRIHAPILPRNSSPRVVSKSRAIPQDRCPFSSIGTVLRSPRYRLVLEGLPWVSRPFINVPIAGPVHRPLTIEATGLCPFMFQTRTHPIYTPEHTFSQLLNSRPPLPPPHKSASPHASPRVPYWRTTSLQ
ncbi:hypothetical protein OF83DRAFT_291080 [Amylostereum chailletii]|nr:hypothetical protein OF83DRAFT_291080 [Amylostereum chailletii]